MCNVDSHWFDFFMFLGGFSNHFDLDLVVANMSLFIEYIYEVFGSIAKLTFNFWNLVGNDIQSRTQSFTPNALQSIRWERKLQQQFSKQNALM